MAEGKKRAAPKRSIPPKHAAGSAKSAFAGKRPEPDGDAPKVAAGGSFSAAGGGVNLGLDNLFGWLGDLVGQMSTLAEKAEQSLHREGEFKIEGLGERARGIYGVSVKMGLGGEPAVQTFGNIHSTKRGPEVSDIREPLVDVFDEDGEVLVVAEMPGVGEEDITVEVSGAELTITAKGAFQYGKEVTLPAAVKPEPLRKSHRNGLLELRFAKA